MADLDVRMILRAYDCFGPLHQGDVPIPGLRLAIDRHAALPLVLDDGIDLAETSFNRYILGRAKGDDRLVGLPAFVMRGFRHRNFFVRAESPLGRLADLAGRRVGTNSWAESGTLWARAAMRDAGVGVEDVRWVLGPLDGATPPARGHSSPHDPPSPKGAVVLAPGETLLGELAAGRIDAVTTAFAPEEVFRKGGALRRLVRDYRAAETDYHRRTGLYPAFHIVVARRAFAEARPEAVTAVYDAMRRSFDLWIEKTKRFADASPWAMAELETLLGDFAEDTPPFGLGTDAHRRMVTAMCQEQEAQGLIARACDPEALFADFERMRRRAG
jgi:4,5-dihydroxyphthalate decarboxylase